MHNYLRKILFTNLFLISIVVAEPTNEPNAENAYYEFPTDINLPLSQNESNNITPLDICDINIQVSNEAQKLVQKYIRRWRALKRGMTLSDVKKLLGEPKLIQCSSHECFLFYQELPTSNAIPHFAFRKGGKQLVIKDRYGNLTEKIGINDVGDIRNGILVFEAKTIEESISEVKAEYNNKIKNFTETHKKIKDGEIERNLRKPEKVINRSDAAERQVESHKVAQEEALRIRIDSQIAQMKKECDGKIAIIQEDSEPRTPIFILKFFNQPDWNKSEMLWARSKAIGKQSEEKLQMQINWKKLQINITQPQIEKLLGQPTRFETNIQGTKLFYGSEPQCGEIFLTPRSDKIERITAWKEPFWGRKTVYANLIPPNVQLFEGKIFQHSPPKIILANAILFSYAQMLFEDPNGNIIYIQKIPTITDEIAAIELQENHYLLNKADRTEFSIYVLPAGIFQYVTTIGTLSTINKYVEYEMPEIDVNSIKPIFQKKN